MTNDGGPAFPRERHVVAEDDEGYHDETQYLFGMSLRDWFAAQALSMLNYHNILKHAEDETECQLQITNAAALSYRLADAMLKEREK